MHSLLAIAFPWSRHRRLVLVSAIAFPLAGLLPSLGSAMPADVRLGVAPPPIIHSAQYTSYSSWVCTHPRAHRPNSSAYYNRRYCCRNVYYHRRGGGYTTQRVCEWSR